MADGEITIGELARNFDAFRRESRDNESASRQDTQRAINKVEVSLEQLKGTIRDAPYLPLPIWEEVRKTQGERIGKLEDEVGMLEQKVLDQAREHDQTIRAVQAKALAVVLTIVTAVVVAALTNSFGL